MSKEQINLPKTAFSMKANLPVKEPDLIKYWTTIDLYKQLRDKSKGQKKFVYMMGLPTLMEIFIWGQLSIRF